MYQSKNIYDSDIKFIYINGPSVNNDPICETAIELNNDGSYNITKLPHTYSFNNTVYNLVNYKITNYKRTIKDSSNMVIDIDTAFSSRTLLPVENNATINANEQGITVTLTPAVPGYTFTFVNSSNIGTFTILCDGDDTFNSDGSNKIVNTDATGYDSITLRAVSDTKWVRVFAVGSWTETTVF
jgi:hypothetical protein